MLLNLNSNEKPNTQKEKKQQNSMLHTAITDQDFKPEKKLSEVIRELHLMNT